jgi:hypothetical protein
VSAFAKEISGCTSVRARGKRAISICARCALDSAVRRGSTAALYVVKRVVAAIVVCLGLSGCWPALKVVQPRAEVKVTGAAGETIEDAKVMFVRANVFPGWHEVLGERLTDASGTVKLPLRLKWHMQIMLPDAYTSYSWAYCVERAGYRAVIAPLERWRRPSTASLNRSLTQTTCVPPDAEYPFLRVSDATGDVLSSASSAEALSNERTLESQPK